jgi:hypothetical protein
MSIEECALLHGFDAPALNTVFEMSPETKQYFELKRLEYKANALRFINKSAKSKEDVKTILSLMERSYPQEYDPSVNRLKARNEIATKDQKDDKLIQVFQFIQQSSDTKDLIKHAHHEEVLEEATPTPYPWK